MRGRSFRLATATIAVVEGKGTITVAAGSIIVVLSDRNPGGLVFVLFDGRRVQMFEKDIRDRGTLIVIDAAGG